MAKHLPYPSYTDTGLGWLDKLPLNWSTERAKLIFFEINQRSDNGAEQLLSVSEYYGIKPRSEVVNEGDFLSRAESLEGYKKCQVDDLVMNIMLAWKRGLAFTTFEGIVSPAYSVFRLKKPYSPKYLNYLLRTDIYIDLFKRWSTGVIDSRLRLYPEVFGRLPIVIPPISEQDNIAAFLDYETAKIDGLIAKQERLIELLKEKRQAVISHAVTKGLNPDAPMKDSGVEWLGEVPAHWGIPSLALKSTRIGDGLHSTPEYEDGTGYYFVNGNNLIDGWVGISTTAKEVPHEEFIKHAVELTDRTVLLSINGTIGNLALYRGEPVILGKSAAYINCFPDLEPEFLYFYLQSDEVKHYYDLEVTGTTIFNLSLQSIRRLRVALPPQCEQKAIVSHLRNETSQYARAINRAKSLREFLNERRTALISAAVTGKIDVRGWQKPNTESKETATAVSA